jgi:hypothetical protein
MKHRDILLLSVIALLAAGVLVAGCTSAPPDTQPLPPGTIPSGSPGTSSCGFTSCHGLDLACGTNAPEVCDMSYRVGDKCRQYAHCSSGSDGTCTLVTTPEFDSCKSCVERCEAIKSSTTDPAMVFECESKC